MSNASLSMDSIESGAHILYTYNEVDKYIKNAANFIAEGIDQSQPIIFVDETELFQKISNSVLSLGYTQEDLDTIIFWDHNGFYIRNEGFNATYALESLSEIFDPVTNQGITIRSWGHVAWREHEHLLPQLRIYEYGCDQFIHDHQTISICAYNGLTTPSYIQNELLKTHIYFMTDDEMCLSPLYKKKHLGFPSISEWQRLQKIEAENKRLQDQNNQLHTEKKMMEMKKEILEQSEKFYHNLINEIPISIMIAQNDNIVYVNNEAIHKLEYSNKAELIGRSMNDLIPINFGKFAAEQSLVLNTGKTKYFTIKAMPTLFNGEQARLYSLIDLSEQKAAEKLMIRSEKLNVAGQLAAGIAHEVRNPLTAVKGFFQMIQNNYDKATYYQIIEGELNRIEQISGELLMLARPHSERHNQWNISDLLEDVKTLLEAQAVIKGIGIISDYQDPQLVIDCDATKLKQVFINLVKNAIEVMDNGGDIHIKARKQNNYVEIKVIDQGKGMPKEILDKIGEPFFTTKEKGTGLGLTICYKIIESHGGTLIVDTKEGIGTSFTVTLPLSRSTVYQGD
ncbi:ATP-binding protein [Tuberibacillus sp. Marseille-P3662]|uniref:ATP-binding protein n=1 Tax=Tuberibacillus sp. Marseille-P3662 TaxID=1965358 RepID=UPI001593361B|nr:ATP-binding protein [Tuberibacillus sp. Marseille-P3662]